MKHSLLFILFITGVVLFSSCHMAKDITYFQDIEKEQSLFGIPEEVPEYRIRPLDNLYINIYTKHEATNRLYNLWQETNNSFTGSLQMQAGLPSHYINGYQVEQSGKITFPILGEIQVAGLTLLEAQRRIKEMAEEHLIDPSVRVRILSFKVNVTGEVRNPGMFYNFQGKLNVIDAISMANGITDDAKINKILVVRQEKFSTKTYNLDLTSKKIFESEAFYLQPDDLIYIPPGKLKNRNFSNVYSVISTLSTVVIALSYLLR